MALSANQHEPGVGPGLDLPLVREIQILRDEQAKNDRRPLHLCPVCLRKFHRGLGFDPLEPVNRALDFAEGAEWLNQPLQALRAA